MMYDVSENNDVYDVSERWNINKPGPFPENAVTNKLQLIEKIRISSKEIISHHFQQ